MDYSEKLKVANELMRDGFTRPQVVGGELMLGNGEITIKVDSDIFEIVKDSIKDKLWIRTSG